MAKNKDDPKHNLSENDIEEVYAWVDSIPLSRQKKDIARDFSDGVLVAELVHRYCPSIVDLHSYPMVHSEEKKKINWNLLNRVSNSLDPEETRIVGVSSGSKLFAHRITISPPALKELRKPIQGVLIAEVVKHHLPKIVDLHNYAKAMNASGKEANWHLLNRKVFKRLNFELAQDIIMNLCKATPYTIEKVLIMLRAKLNQVEIENQRRQNEKPEADQYQAPSPGRKGGQQKMKAFVMDDVSMKTQRGNQSDLNKQIQKEEKLVLENNRGMAIPKKKVVRSLLEPDVVPRLKFEEVQQQKLGHEETIQIMDAKIKRLEHLLYLKDIRIEELQKRLESTRPTGVKHF